MKKRHIFLIIIVTIATAFMTKTPVKSPVLVSPSPVSSFSPVPVVSNGQCDQSLWQHVYHGHFSTPQDRLSVIKDCVTVSGTIQTAKSEADGDYHIRLTLDSQFSGMTNDKNVSGQHGDLVVEPVCANPVSQADTMQEGVCDNFSQNIFDGSMIGKHVEVTGAYVTDMQHGWNEIHPVTSIVVK